MAISIQYQKYREQMKNGDILLFKGSNILSQIIQWRTGSVYSHAGLVVWWNGRLMVLEAMGRGVVVAPISYNLNHYKGDIDYFRPTIELSDTQRLAMVSFAQNQLSKKFGLIKIISFFIKLMAGIKLAKLDSLKPKGKYFCSEYVAQIYNIVGIDLVPDFSESYTSPDKLEKSEYLEIVGTLLNAD
ncbi:MAG: hypothetical protein ACI90U_001849 [Pseudomonadales bacterium]|jgi:hypothetical protein